MEDEEVDDPRLILSELPVAPGTVSCVVEASEEPEAAVELAEECLSERSTWKCDASRPNPSPNPSSIGDWLTARSRTGGIALTMRDCGAVVNE